MKLLTTRSEGRKIKGTHLIIFEGAPTIPLTIRCVPFVRRAKA
jgi:hypothetical protein